MKDLVVMKKKKFRADADLVEGLLQELLESLQEFKIEFSGKKKSKKLKDFIRILSRDKQVILTSCTDSDIDKKFYGILIKFSITEELPVIS